MKNDQKQPHEKIVTILGCAGSGKATIMGNMIYKCGGIEMPIMEQFQKRGVKTYGEVLKELKAIGETPYFYTPNNKLEMTYAGESPSVAEGVIIVFTPIEKSEQVSISTKDDLHQLKEFGSDLDKKRVIVLINKLDTYDWSESVFTKAVNLIADDLGLPTEITPFIPVSGLHGDNLIEPSSKTPWYSILAEDSSVGSRKGSTLLAAIDAMFADA